MRRLPLLCAATALVGCNDPGVVIGELHDTLVLKAIPNRDLDLLFVIDDSPSTLDKQIAFTAAFPQMMSILAQLDGGLPNVHIGVVTSDMGTSASASAPGPAIGSIGQGGCWGTGKAGLLQVASPNVIGTFISDVEMPDGTRLRNYTGSLEEAFTANASVGAGGCGFEQHLAAMSAAFSAPANAGFLRPTANLAVIVLADEDDCSLHDAAMLGPETAELGAQQSFRCFRFGVTCDEDSATPGDKTNCRSNAQSPYVDDVQRFVDELRAAKPDERMVMVSVIAGDPTPVAVELRAPGNGGAALPALAHSCGTTGGSGQPSLADPAVRLAQFAAAFPERNTFTSVCSSDLSPALQEIGESAKGMMGDPCLDSSQLADVAPELPGVQPSCEVVDIPDSSPRSQSPLAACSSGMPDCYEIVADAAACPATADHLRVKLTRTSEVSDDTWTYVRCKRNE